MPMSNPAPNFALLTAYDMRTYSGITAFTRGSTSVTMPTFATGAGVYDDAILFLNGRSSDTQISAAGQIATSKTFGSSWVVELTAADKVKITTNVDFTLTNVGTVDALGAGSSTLNATLSSATYSVTFPNDWTRGAVNLGDVSYRVDEVGGAGSFTFPDILTHTQDVTVFIRDRSAVSDADVFGLASLEERDQAAMSDDRISWFIDDTGRVASSYLTSLGSISWSSTEIRDLLGFTGDETPVVYSSSYSLITATHKAAGVLVPSRPYQRHHIKAENVSQSRRLIGGGYVSNYVGTYATSMLNFDLDARLDLSDDYQHFIHRWMPYASSGERVNFYQSWGDSRRALRTDQINASQPAYDSLFTSESNGDCGRIRSSIVTPVFDLSYPTRLRRRVPVSMELEHL